MSDKIFLVKGDNQLVAMERTKYSLEDHLQELLARYPDLMPGEQINPSEPRRWLLVSREIGIPDSETANDRWSLDHLFLDQDGVPTLVEAKRSTDPRIRREVVGQLLEYAANAQSYWTVDQLRTRILEKSASEPESDFLNRTLGVIDEEGFWQKVKSNLQSGRLRLIFVADAIPKELKRMIEFLNTQMDPAEVYGIELPQFLGGEMQTIVPRLIGNTAQAVERKAASGGLKFQWDEETFFGDLKDHQSAEESALVRKFHDWCLSEGLRISWGQGTREGSFIAVLDAADTSYQLIRMESRGRFQIMLDFIRGRPAFEKKEVTGEVIRELNDTTTLDIPESAKRPSLDTSLLLEPQNLSGLENALSKLIQQIRNFH